MFDAMQNHGWQQGPPLTELAGTKPSGGSGTTSRLGDGMGGFVVG
jgi:hypothetical protein